MIEKPKNASLNMTNLSTLIAVAILVGTEFVGAAWAFGWAIAGLYGFDPLTAKIIEVFFALIGLACLFYFMRQAVKAEPIYGNNS